ncbi:biotin transporter BioY [bacterium]|nr:biotin transporter BioY [bacterium]
MPARQQRSGHVSISLVLIPLFAALTATGGIIRIPLPPVPFTLQTLFVYMAGALLGARRGAASQLLYLAVGLMGIPVFGAGGGPGYILQPTFGYLLGFPAAAWLTGRLTASLPGRIPAGKLIRSGLTAMPLIIGPGACYLYLNLTFISGTGITLWKTIWTGIIVFLPAEMIKLVIAAVITERLTAISRFREATHA